LDVPEADGVGTGIEVSEASVNDEGVMEVEVGPGAEAVAGDAVFAGEIAVARAGGKYCEIVEFSGTE
jgi:hypothetical protein